MIDLAAWRACKDAERGPTALAFDAYHAAALALLQRWAPNSAQLRAQICLAAEMAGLPDPQGEPSHKLETSADTPAGALTLIYLASLGLWQAEKRSERVRR